LKKSKIASLFSIIILLNIFIIRFNIQSNYKIKNENKTSGIIIDCLNNSKMIVKGKDKILVDYNFPFTCKPGIKIKTYGGYEIPEDSRVFNLFNYRKYLLSKKIKYIFKAKKIEKIPNKIRLKYKIKNEIHKYLEKYKSKDYMYSFLLADSSNIDKTFKENYKKNGIIHLFAVSGIHITIMTSILLFVLNNILKDKDTSFFIVFIFLIFYISITNFPPSLVRSAILFISLNISKSFNLKIKSIHIIIYSFLILLIINPFYIYSVGFILSYIISFFIILSNKIIKKCKNYFTKSLVISLISLLASYPVIINNNFEINLLSPILSLIFTPLICFIIYPLCLISLVFKPFDIMIYNIMNLFNYTLSILKDVNIFTISFSRMNITFIITYYLILSSCIIKNKNYYLIIIFIIIHYNINLLSFYPKVTFIDVGQGDSILIRQKTSNILIDTGGDTFYKEKELAKTITVPYLKSEGIHKLNFLIISHGDFDHMGEAVNLVENFKVEKVIFNCGEFNDLETDLIKVLNKKKIPYYSCIKELNIDNNKLYFLQTKEYDNENDNSNVMYTEIDSYKFMFMGDAGVEKEKDILSKYNISDIDALKVGHHGSKTSSSIDFINEINPKYSIISVGKNNRYGHPNKEVLENLKDSKIYRTDQNGSVMFKIKKNKLQVEACSP